MSQLYKGQKPPKKVDEELKKGNVPPRWAKWRDNYTGNSYPFDLLIYQLIH